VLRPSYYLSMANHRDRIGIEFISVFGLPPVEFVGLAADLGCRHIGVAVIPIRGLENPHGYPEWSLREDAGLRRQMIAVMRDRDVSISLGEGFIGLPGAGMEAAAGDLDVMAELGAGHVNFLSVDPDRSRAFDQCGAFARMAATRGLKATLEFLPCLSIGDLASAVAAVHHVGMPNFQLLLDAMHVFRSGATAADVATLDADLIGYVQLCDVPRVSRYANYADEARHHRLPPGKGELPLLDLLVATPPDVVVGLEVPRLKEAQAGVLAYERLGSCVAATRELLARADALKAGAGSLGR
jgi:sugar phosphate isomerase/epimerase